MMIDTQDGLQTLLEEQKWWNTQPQGFTYNKDQISRLV